MMRPPVSPEEIHAELDAAVERVKASAPNAVRDTGVTDADIKEGIMAAIEGRPYKLRRRFIHMGPVGYLVIGLALGLLVYMTLDVVGDLIQNAREAPNFNLEQLK